MSIAEILCSGSDRELDPKMHPKIRAWSDPPTALQILEVLDACIHGALASGFVIKSLQRLYERACSDEGTTHEAVASVAPWRSSQANSAEKP